MTSHPTRGRTIEPLVCGWATRIQHDEDLADISALPNGGSSAESLLAAAESAFARRAIDSALVVCPAGWASKIALLEQRGYQTAKLWMLKR